MSDGRRGSMNGPVRVHGRPKVQNDGVLPRLQLLKRSATVIRACAAPSKGAVAGNTVADKSAANRPSFQRADAKTGRARR